jgi:hypothetical protein
MQWPISCLRLIYGTHRDLAASFLLQLGIIGVVHGLNGALVRQCPFLTLQQTELVGQSKAELARNDTQIVGAVNLCERLCIDVSILDVLLSHVHEVDTYVAVLFAVLAV